MPRVHLLIATLVMLALPAANAQADAVIRSQAMRASTIAEYFIDEGHVRLELEIGMGDLEAFRNLLPEKILERMEQDATPLAERLPEFFSNDLVIALEDGEPLTGRILEMKSRSRVRRDEISGAPLPVKGEEETVIFAVLEYALPRRVRSLELRGPRTQTPLSIGYVVYHGLIPVNDFRYLGPSQKLQLDWQDPWYTAFESRSLRRQNFAPMSGFLYVEPYEVRKEIIARPIDLQHWIDLGLDGRQTIPIEAQADLLRRVAEFLRGHQPVEIDGVAVAGELARVNFLERSLRTSRVIDPPVELDVHSAIIGVIFVYPTDGFPQRVTMDWDLWSDRIQQIPAASVDQAGPLPVLLEPDWRVLEWQNFLKHPELPTLRLLAEPPSSLARGYWMLRWWLLTATVLALTLAVARQLKRRAGIAAVLVAAGVAHLVILGIWLSRDAALSDDRAGEIVAGLLHNIYRAFDFRDEEKIYDVLARSIEGELLERVYLETRRSLELVNQGGARAKVKSVELVEIAAEPADEGAFVAQATWNVGGSVGHWGHVHERRNRYRAELRVSPRDAVWKLSALEILEEERL